MSLRVNALHPPKTNVEIGVCYYPLFFPLGRLRRVAHSRAIQRMAYRGALTGWTRLHGDRESQNPWKYPEIDGGY
jgi:hypothetical protein